MKAGDVAEWCFGTFFASRGVEWLIRSIGEDVWFSPNDVLELFFAYGKLRLTRHTLESIWMSRNDIFELFSSLGELNG